MLTKEGFECINQVGLHVKLCFWSTDLVRHRPQLLKESLNFDMTAHKFEPGKLAQLSIEEVINKLI